MKRPESLDLGMNQRQDNISREKRSRICVVTVTFNDYEVTKETVKQINNQNISSDIIVVDNNSEDGTFEKLSNNYDNIILLQTNENVGSAGGFNVGQSYAYQKGYEYVILTDNDAYPRSKDLLRKIKQKSNPTTVVQPYNEAADTEKNKSIWFFHWIGLHRDTIE